MTPEKNPYPWSGTIRRSSGLVEHVCEHGVGHPAIGSAKWLSLVHGGKTSPHAIHGCDGCCRTKEWRLADVTEGLAIAEDHLERLQSSLHKQTKLVTYLQATKKSLKES